MLIREREDEKNEQKKRIQEAHLSLDREKAEKLRQKDRYIEQLNFYGG